MQDHPYVDPIQYIPLFPTKPKLHTIKVHIEHATTIFGNGVEGLRS